MLKKFGEEKRKQYIALGIAAVVLGGGTLLLSYIFGGGKKQEQKAPPPKVDVLEPAKMEEESFKKEYGEKLAEIQQRLRELEQRERSATPPPTPPPLISPPPMQSSPPPTQSPPFPPPPPAQPSPQEQTQSPQQVQQPPKPQLLTDLIVVEGKDRSPLPTQQQQQPQNTNTPSPTPRKQETQKPSSRIPSGAFVRGILLSGLDAPTGGRAQSQPHPVLIRIVDKAILPNFYKSDIKDCFVIGAGYGDLASERAYIRLETISCVKKSGEVIERKVFGFVSGEDGKVGLQGRVVSKQGQVLARMLVAGFIDGISKIFQQSGTTVIVSPTGATQSIDPNQALRVGLAGGFSSAARELVEFYKKLAEETYPVVEINAGRNVDLVFLQSISFSTKEEKEEGRGQEDRREQE